MQDLDQLVKIIPGLGVSGVLIILVWGLLKGWFVTGREHQNLSDLYLSLQRDQQVTRLEIQRLKDRDDSQQSTIDQQGALINEYRQRIEQLEREIDEERDARQRVTAERDALRIQLNGGKP